MSPVVPIYMYHKYNSVQNELLLNIPPTTELAAYG